MDTCFRLSDNHHLLLCEYLFIRKKHPWDFNTLFLYEGCEAIFQHETPHVERRTCKSENVYKIGCRYFLRWICCATFGVLAFSRVFYAKQGVGWFFWSVGTPNKSKLGGNFPSFPEFPSKCRQSDKVQPPPVLFWPFHFPWFALIDHILWVHSSWTDHTFTLSSVIADQAIL